MSSSKNGIVAAHVGTLFLLISVSQALSDVIEGAGAADGIRRAREEIHGDAIEQKAPTGIFGVHWLASPEELQVARPNAVKGFLNSFAEVTVLNGRPVQISYLFHDNMFTLVTLTFLGRSTAEDY